MTKRKVKRDSDRTQPITVDVTHSSVEEKKKVQQAFFDVGIKWTDFRVDGEGYKFLESNCYSNVTKNGYTVEYLIPFMSPHDSGLRHITPKEFFNMVYEEEDKEMEEYIKVDDLNSFKWMLKDTSKDVYIEFIKRDVKVGSYCNFEGKDFCHNFWGCVVSADIHALTKYKDKGCKEVFFIDGEFYTKNNAIDFNYEEYCKGGYVVMTRGGMLVTQVKRFDLGGDFPIAGVVSDFLIDTWSDKGVHCSLNSKDNSLVMYKV